MAEILTEFEKNCRTAVEMKRYAERKRSWVAAQRSHFSREAYGHSGASVAPDFTSADEIHAMAEYLGGARTPHFDMTQKNLFYDLMEELGLKIYRRDSNGEDVFPFQCHAVDPDVSPWVGERFFAVWTPEGDFYAVYDRGAKLHICQTARPNETPENLLREAMGAIRQHWARLMDDRAYELAEKNKMRAERGLPLYENWAHCNDPGRFRHAPAA